MPKVFCFIQRNFVFSKQKEKKTLNITNKKKMTSIPGAVVKSVGTMSKDLEMEALKVASEAMELLNSEQAMAHQLKEHFDRKFSPTWHCFVGRNFGSYVTHQTGHYIYFYIGQMGFLLFKSG